MIYTLDRDAAAIALVDSNLHREKILPSERAFAYKLKAEALKHQGQRTDLTSVQVAPKWATEQIAENAGTSKDTIPIVNDSAYRKGKVRDIMGLKNHKVIRGECR